MHACKDRDGHVHDACMDTLHMCIIMQRAIDMHACMNLIINQTLLRCMIFDGTSPSLNSSAP